MLFRIGADDDPDLIALRERVERELALEPIVRAPILHADPHAFGRLVGEGARTFLRRVWGKEHRLFRDAERAEWLTSVVTRAAYDRAFREGRVPASTVKTIGTGRASREPVSIGSAERLQPELRTFCLTLERELRMPVEARVLDVPVGSSVLPRTDANATFLLPLEGEIEWSLFGRSKRGATAPPSRRLHRVTMRSGDCLYLPHGEWNAARASGTSALVLELSLRELTWLDVLRWLGDDALRRCGEDLFFRRNCPPHPADWSSADHAHLAEALRRFRDAFQLNRADDLIEDCYLTWSRAPDEGPAPAPPRDTTIELATEVTRTPAIFFTRKVDGQLVLKLANKKIFFPSTIDEAFEFVTQRERFRVRDIPQLSPKSRVVLARRLVREGFLRA